MPPTKSARANNTGSPLGFEATAMRDSVISSSTATLRSLRAAKDNRWLTTL